MDEEEKSVRVSDFFYYLLKGRRLILIFAAVGLILGIALSGINYLRGEMSKEYRITSSIAIIAQTSTGSYASTKNVPNSDDVQLAQEITDSAIYILNSERTLKAAIENAHLEGITVKDIQKNLTLSQYNDTQIIEMALTWRSSAEGTEILDAINDVSDEILLETLKIGKVSVVNSPSSRYIIGGKISASTWVMGAGVGAAIAALLCVLKLFLSPRLTNISDYDLYFSTKVIGTVAYDKHFGESVPFAKEGSKAQKDMVTLANILANSMDAEGCRKLIVTSTIRGEGRTSLTVNIAKQLADTGKKTLMVDCDFSNPTLSSLFAGQIQYERTLNAVYFGQTSEREAVRHISGCLDLLPVILSDDGIALDDAMLDIIDHIAGRYEYVLFDCPPVGTDAEVLYLKRITKTALFLTKHDYAELDRIEEAILRVKGAGIHIIGSAVTSVSTIRDLLKEKQKLSVFIGKTYKRIENEEQKSKMPVKEKHTRKSGKKKNKNRVRLHKRKESSHV